MSTFVSYLAPPEITCCREIGHYIRYYITVSQKMTCIYLTFDLIISDLSRNIFKVFFLC